MVGVASLGAWVTDIGPWYRALRKPSWQPPDWAFGPAWSTIFLCAAVALVLAWRVPGADRSLLLGIWVVNAVLNVTWSVLFFRLQRPDWAVWEVVPLWLSILWMLLAAGRLSPTAGWLMVPYLAWVTFATVLNRAIIARNTPFGR
jgi:tryptophan-rich sensory protein